MSDKPLHVQVAEALGCKPRNDAGWWKCGCRNNDHGSASIVDEDGDEHNNPDLPRYDTDWRAAGPLIERFGIQVSPWDRPVRWYAAVWNETESGAIAETDGQETPLLAVCHLILALYGPMGVRRLDETSKGAHT